MFDVGSRMDPRAEVRKTGQALLREIAAVDVAAFGLLGEQPFSGECSIDLGSTPQFKLASS